MMAVEKRSRIRQEHTQLRKDGRYAFESLANTGAAVRLVIDYLGY